MAITAYETTITFEPATTSHAESITTAHTAVMGAAATVQIVGGPRSLADLAIAELHALESLWAGLLPDVHLIDLRLAAGHEVPVSARTRRLIRAVIDAHDDESGPFDPALILELRALGHTAAGEPDRPLSATGKHRRDDGVAEVVLNASSAAHDPGVVGRGWAADLVAETLISHGADGAIVAIGGDARAMGHRGEGPDWRIDVVQPRIPHPALRRLHLTNGGVATCSVLPDSWLEADLDTAADLDGLSHQSWDAAAGFPIEAGVVTATVIARTGAWAQTLAAACLTLDGAEARDLLNHHHVEGHLVNHDGTVLETAAWADFAR